MPDAQVGGEPVRSRLVDQITGAGHDEFYVGVDIDHFAGGGQKMLGAFLGGDAGQEKDDFFILVDTQLPRLWGQMLRAASMPL